MDIDCRSDKLSSQNSLLAKLLDFSNEAIFAWELNGPIIFWNKGAEKKYGYRSEEAIGYVAHSLLKTNHPLGLDETLSILEKKGYWEGELIHTTRDGRELIIESKQQVIKDDLGKSIVLETNRNITEQKRKDEELIKSIKMNSDILESISDGFYSLDRDWRFTYINRRAANNAGLETEAFLNKNIWDMYKVLKGTIVESNYKRAMYNQESVHFETPGIMNGRYYQCNVYPSKEGISVYWIDMTEKKAAEIKLAEANALAENQAQQLNTILENMSEGVMIIDKNRHVRHINSSGMKLHGYDSLDYNGFKNYRSNYNFFDLNGNPIAAEDLPAEKGIRGESFIDYTMVLQRKDMEYEWIGSYNGMPLYDENGEFDLAILTVRDITEHVRHLELLYKAEAEKAKREMLEKSIAAKDEFLSLVSHEFKTPISIINSAVQVMEQVCKDELSQKAKGYLKKIRQNSYRQLRLVNNILEMSRITGSHNKSNCNYIDIIFLTKAIIDSVVLYAQQKDITLSFICSVKQKVICIDDDKYERILLNLLSNAIKYSAEGKNITVSLKFYNKMISLIVKDEGIGIPKDKLDYIFEKFGQVDSTLARHAEGTGIGLSLVKLLAESLGGSISVNSSVGHGSTFIVRLPLLNSHESISEKPSGEMINSRVHQKTAIELSDIYL